MPPGERLETLQGQPADLTNLPKVALFIRAVLIPEFAWQVSRFLRKLKQITRWRVSVMSDMDSSTVVEVQDLKVHFPVTGGSSGRRSITLSRRRCEFSIKAGETFSLVGESGCGKSTTAMAILKMQEATEGKVYLFGSDITELNTKQMRLIEGGCRWFIRILLGRLTRV